MVHIEPFRGVRPRRDIAHLVAAPPYDVLSTEEAREMAAGNPYSFLHIGKPEIDLPPGPHVLTGRVRQGFEVMPGTGVCIFLNDETGGSMSHKQGA